MESPENNYHHIIIVIFFVLQSILTVWQGVAGDSIVAPNQVLFPYSNISRNNYNIIKLKLSELEARLESHSRSQGLFPSPPPRTRMT